MGVFRKMTLMSITKTTSVIHEQRQKSDVAAFREGPMLGEEPTRPGFIPLVLPMTARKRQKCGRSGLHHAELLERELTLGLAKPPARLDEIEARAGSRLKRNARQSLGFTSQIARALRNLAALLGHVDAASGLADLHRRVASGGLQTLQRLIGLRAGVSKGAVACATFEERERSRRRRSSTPHGSG